MQEDQILPIGPGTAVRVSDGTPEPPKRFNRKHSAWECRNYDGVVTRHEPAGPFSRTATYTVQHGDLNSGWIKLLSSGIPEHGVSVIPGAPGYQLTNESEPTVVGIAGPAAANAA